MGKKRIKFGNALLCEYATQGNRNKHMLINVYSGNVRFDALPADFSCGIYVELPAQDLKTVDVLVRLDREEILRAAVEAEAGKDGTIVIRMLAMEIDKPATLTVSLEAPDKVSTTVISKRLYVTDSNA
ncbi:MAG: hypothetical protein WD005_01435 [Haliea sp.]